MNNTYVASRHDLEAALRRGTTAARHGGMETCGLLVRRKRRLELLHLNNKVKKGGSFAFYVGEVQSAIALTNKVGGTVVGTFHSHPVGLAEPGPADVANAANDSLMLIFDCLGKRWKLWHVRGGRIRAA